MAVSRPHPTAGETEDSAGAAPGAARQGARPGPGPPRLRPETVRFPRILFSREGVLWDTFRLALGSLSRSYF